MLVCHLSRSRGVVNGVAAALNYLFGFITKKTYYNLETTLSMPGTALFYCVICGIGLIFTYNVLPETEGRSLEEIELHFADNSKNMCHREIAKKPKCKSEMADSMNQLSAVDLKYGSIKVANEIGHDNKAFECDKC